MTHSCNILVTYPVTMIKAHHAKVAMVAQNVKTDKNDAKGIADIMRTGWFKGVHIKNALSQRLKIRLNNRKCLVEMENHHHQNKFVE